MAKYVSFRKKGKVSIWLGLHKSKEDPEVDILKDLCGVMDYDLDNQEVSAIDDDFTKAPVAEIVGLFSYSSSFLDAALQAAEDKQIGHAYWALAQFDFAYDQRRIKGAIAVDPHFLGVFDWNDSEDDE